MRRDRKAVNPRRLQHLLKDIREKVLHLSREEMSNRLNEASRKLDKKPVVRFSVDSIKNLERGDTAYQYIHLETYANLLAVPVGVLLLISRFQHSSPGEILSVVGALHNILVAAAENREVITYDHLPKLAEQIQFVQFHDVREKIAEADYHSEKSNLQRLDEIRRRQENLGNKPGAGLPLWEKPDN